MYYALGKPKAVIEPVEDRDGVKYLVVEEEDKPQEFRCKVKGDIPIAAVEIYVDDIKVLSSQEQKISYQKEFEFGADHHLKSLRCEIREANVNATILDKVIIDVHSKWKSFFMILIRPTHCQSI